MGIRYDIKLTDFYNELPPEKQEEYFGLCQQKFLPATDNIYYMIYLEHDANNNFRLQGLMSYLDKQKQAAQSEFQPQPFILDKMIEHVKQYYKANHVDEKLNVDDFFKIECDVDILKGDFDIIPTNVPRYKYGFSKPDLYDIFITDHLPNDVTPRVYVQLRAFGLWTRKPLDVLAESYRVVAALFGIFGFKVLEVMENRIDFCYHTNALHRPDKVLSEKNLKKNLKTQLTTKFSVETIEEVDKDDPDYCCGGLRFKKSYLSIGKRKSKNYILRIYNKAEEVVQLGYKGFFLEIWYQNRLISFYDKFCYEYAYKQKDNNAIYKAMLLFYLEYGTDELVKKEFRLILEDHKSTYAIFKAAAKSYMPQLTTVMNIEFETLRNFYRYSDDYIDQVLYPVNHQGQPKQLERLITILDNRGVFINWLSRHGVCFLEDNRLPMNGSNYSEDLYVNWWKRMRATKLKDNITPFELIRTYNHHMDKNAVLHKLINQAENYAAQNEIFDQDIGECVLDMLGNINDNDLHELHQDLKRRQEFFNYNVQRKHRRIKNRLKRSDKMTHEDAKAQAEGFVFSISNGEIMDACDERGFKYKRNSKGLLSASERRLCEIFLIDSIIQQLTKGE